MRKKQKRIKQDFKTTIFRFWNTGKEYFCVITSSVEVPKYRLKEAFDRNFIGKKDLNDLKYNVNEFKKIDNDITYEIKSVKEQ